MSESSGSQREYVSAEISTMYFLRVIIYDPLSWSRRIESNRVMSIQYRIDVFQYHVNENHKIRHGNTCPDRVEQT